MTGPTRSLVRQRGGGRCEYCLYPEHLSRAPLHVEHIRARQHGGSDDPTNLALACDRCNRRKGPNLSGIDPQSDLVTPLFNPRADRWDDHFCRDGLHIVGVTPIGRATADLLRFNDAVRLALRAAPPPPPFYS